MPIPLRSTLRRAERPGELQNIYAALDALSRRLDAIHAERAQLPTPVAVNVCRATCALDCLRHRLDTLGQKINAVRAADARGAA